MKKKILGKNLKKGKRGEIVKKNFWKNFGKLGIVCNFIGT